jgi:hypothetical protein
MPKDKPTLESQQALAPLEQVLAIVENQFQLFFAPESNNEPYESGPECE